MADIDTWTARVDSLERAVSSGTLVVRHGDTSVTYRSMSDLMQALAYAKGQVDKLNGTSGRKPNYVEQRTKGL